MGSGFRWLFSLFFGSISFLLFCCRIWLYLFHDKIIPVATKINLGGIITNIIVFVLKSSVEINGFVLFFLGGSLSPPFHSTSTIPVSPPLGRSFIRAPSVPPISPPAAACPGTSRRNNIIQSTQEIIKIVTSTGCGFFTTFGGGVGNSLIDKIPHARVLDYFFLCRSKSSDVSFEDIRCAQNKYKRNTHHPFPPPQPYSS